ncbi:P-loop NTPase fold protein [Streptomyces longwoodensis]|uniref:P-loop NTPase fold protein n=1 Tax=Streptomyces longwoodensis TaxID=68231 RepID=UPI0033D1438E
MSLRTVEVGAITIWGVSDVPTATDLLNRGSLATAIASQIKLSERGMSAHGDLPEDGRAGPSVITLEGPWGAGKSTLMKLIRATLEKPRPDTPAGHDRDLQRLTVREVVKTLRRNHAPENSDESRVQEPGFERHYASAWFNPWSHQSGEQVWAGLAQTIIEAAAPVLYPTEAHKERYWLNLNLKRLDNYVVLRAIRRSISSPLLSASLVAIALPLAIALLQFNGSVPALGERVSTPVLALLLPLIFLLAGIAHTAMRYWRGWAVTYMPGTIFRGPIQEITYSAPGSTATPHESLVDPLQQAGKGSLYLRQHDVMQVLSDIHYSGYDLVIFIDDLDRCQATTTAEVIEAVNVFLTELADSPAHVRFVVGMDPHVIAGHLDTLHGDPHNPRSGSLGDDPSIGWAFLRKLSQLPVAIPYISDDGLDKFLKSVTGAAMGVSTSTPGLTSRGSVDTFSLTRRRVTLATSSSSNASITNGPGSGTTSVSPSNTIAWRTMEQHPRIRALLKERLSEQPDRSLREAKRLINVWQLYVRLTAQESTALTGPDLVTHGCRLVILAEILTRWPALHPALHRRVEEHSVLQYLAAAAASDEEWAESMRRCDLAAGEQEQALTHLRALLTRYDGREVAQIAARLL